MEYTNEEITTIANNCKTSFELEKTTQTLLFLVRNNLQSRSTHTFSVMKNRARELKKAGK